MRSLVGLVAVPCLLAACATAPGVRDDPGPFPDNYEQIVQNKLNETLKDPYSVRDLSIPRPMVTTVWTGLVNGGNLHAWGTCVRYNAKNSFGAYVGLRAYMFYIKAWSVVYVVEGC